MFLPHFDAFCDLLLKRRTATWTLKLRCDHRSCTWKKVFRASTGLEPMASALALQGSNKWAMKTHMLGADQYIENQPKCENNLSDYIKKIDSMLPRACSVINHRRRQNVLRPSVTHSDIASWATLFVTSTYFDVICDLLLKSMPGKIEMIS